MQDFLYLIIFAGCFIVHSYFFFRIIGRIVPFRIKKNTYHTLVAFNGAFFASLFYYYPNHTSWIYIILIIVFIIEAKIQFNSSFLLAIAASLTLPIHLIANRAIFLSTISLIDGIPIYHLFQNTSTYWTSLIFSSVFSTICIIISLLAIKEEYFKLMNQSKSRLALYLCFMLISISRLTITSFIYVLPIENIIYSLEILTSSISWLSVVYFGILILIGFELLDNRRKSLESKAEVTKLIKNSLLDKADMIIEANITKNQPIYVERFKKKEDSFLKFSYSELIEIFVNSEIIAEDRNHVREKLSLLSIINSFQNDQKELVIVTQVLLPGNNEYLWYQAEIQISMITKTQDIYVLIACTNIHEEKTKEIELIHKAERDPLVGAYNKSTARILIDKSIHEFSSGTLFMLDLDNFKAINDTYGHTYGDQVLIEVHRILHKIFRDEDIIGRIGGDEFIIYIKDVNKVELAVEKAIQICKQIDLIYEQDGHSIRVTTSVGVAFAPRDGKDFDQLFENADIAMYKSKNSGKCNYSIYQRYQEEVE